jgi:hypothetical protein
MNPVLKKMHYSGQEPVLVLNAPEEVTELVTSFQKIHSKVSTKYTFILGFAITAVEAIPLVKQCVNSIDGDSPLWFCYPKGSSKKYKADINRNSLAELFAPYDFEPVTQIAIDDDWSAMRFRYADHIKTLTRKTAVSAKGKERIKK